MASNRVKNNQNLTADEVVLDGIVRIMNRSKKGSWIGTMTNLSDRLVSELGKKRVDFLPASPSALRVVLNRITNRLRSKSVKMEFSRSTDSKRTRYVSLSQ